MKKQIIAHRGHPAVYHENTLISFQSAVDNHADYIEFDIRRTADNQLIAFHDPYIENNGIQISLSKLTTKEINTIAATRGFAVPLVEEIFAQFSKKILFDIELKEEHCEHEVLELLKNYAIPLENVLFTSFKIPVLTTLKSINPKITTGFLFEHADMFEKCSSLIVDFYCPEQSLYQKNRDFFAGAAKSGITAAVWTVNDQENLMNFFNDSCVTAVITNRCDLAYKLYTL